MGGRAGVDTYEYQRDGVVVDEGQDTSIRSPEQGTM